ncbi:MAG: type II toxin-antitoxin system HigB family toxin [Saprospiraceae bacterium]|nr:type II toxin-antitoxin system HigB family toxin [Saprospiraceae bacterium]MCF8249170.1 type II toxin-antitoxin system HigB family toxin [Saprospiraceae bacterium]MCF8278888.1 type II toxin-antitoxin system HigB family toxin [Bacteroidales bacterium]MCF8311299.1 type II toxin-antitoxin system HigB family toxin [Saprospiraceae bacterium]MCF8440137.1 type II toxin-antitoxin system HigB family toxin [Saprospiraceae bacterium]
MVVISKTLLSQFGQQHADAADALDDWYKKVKQAEWGNLAELRQSFSAVDYVGNDRYVFNIKGNRYRLVAMIFFDIRTLFVRFIGTHAEYNKIDCSTI